MSAAGTAGPLEDADVVVVGAGLAGLRCAGLLQAGGTRVRVLEAGDDVGGRVRADVVDGFRCERGFQVLNPAYPELGRAVDVAALRLRSFPAGVSVADTHGSHTVLDPRRSGGPAGLVATLRSATALRLGRPGEIAALLRWLADAARHDGEELLSRPDEPWGAALDRRGVTGPLRDGVLGPFLAGVVGEDDGSTSHRFVQLLVRSFLRGTPALPEDGMHRLPALLAATLAPGTVRLRTTVTAVRRAAGAGWRVETDDGSCTARAVVVATDAAVASRLVGTPDPGVRALTTWWFAAEPDERRGRALHVDSQRRGPLVSSVDISATVASAAPRGRSLIAATVLGVGTASEREVRHHLGLVHAGAAAWETVAVHPVAAALTRMPPPLQARRPVAWGDDLFVCGDHRDTASIQGALVSGRRAATALLDSWGTARTPTQPATPSGPVG